MKIVTIDFDIMMWKDIQLYNSWITAHEPVDNWIQSFPLLEHLEFDASLYQYLTEYILKINPAKIKFITSHEEILDYIPKDKEVTLVNIDHHHDIWYDDSHRTEKECGNWVHYLLKRSEIENYIWVTDENAIDPDKKYRLRFNYSKENVKTFSFDKLAKETDLLVICLSPTWVPEKYHPYFEVWKCIVSA